MGPIRSTRSFQYRPPVMPSPGGSASNGGQDTRYSLLFRVDFRHSFFNGAMDRCPGFTVSPTADTRTLMDRLDLLFRGGATGFAVYYNMSKTAFLNSYLRTQSAAPASPAQGQPGCWTRLTFIMVSDNPDFVGITDLPITTDPNEQNLYACNSQAHAADPLTLLCGGDSLSRQDLYPVTDTETSLPLTPGQRVVVTDLSGAVVKMVPAPPDPSQTVRVTVDFSDLPLGFYTASILDAGSTGPDGGGIPLVYTTGTPAPLCLLDILLTQPNRSMGGIYPVPPLWTEGEDGAAIGGIAYTLPFRGRSTRWRYYVAPLGTGGTFSDLRIEGQDATFDQASQPVVLPNGVPAVLFTSRSPLPLHQHPPQRFRLSGQRRNADGSEQDISINRLPAAPPAPVWPGPADDGGISEIFVYA